MFVVQEIAAAYISFSILFIRDIHKTQNLVFNLYLYVTVHSPCDQIFFRRTIININNESLVVIRVEIIFHNIVIVFSIQICIMNINVRVQCDQEYHDECLIVVSLVTIVLLCHLWRPYNLPVHNSASSLALFLPFFPSFSFF